MSLSILVADDEPGFRDLFAFALEPLGYHVTAVADGAQAVAQVAMRAFDLVVLDQHMPMLDGLEALQQIRSLLPEQAIVMLGGDVTGADRFAAEALAHGATRCLFKPLELPELVSAVEEHATRRS